MSRLAVLAVILGAVVAVSVAPVHAVTPSETLDDPALEARARALSAEIRCLVCQNQSIDESDADLAKDLRVLIRKRLTAGDDETTIRTFLVERYGEFVLLKPPFRLGTWLLWFGPLIVFVAGAAGLVTFLRRRGAAAPSGGDGLSAAEKARLEKLLDADGSHE